MQFRAFFGRFLSSRTVTEQTLIYWKNSALRPYVDFLFHCYSDPYLASAEFSTMLDQARDGSATFAMIDEGVRAIMLAQDVKQWLADNKLGSTTSLTAPVVDLLSEHPAIIVITDEDGMASLGALRCERVVSPLARNGEAIFVQVTL